MMTRYVNIKKTEKMYKVLSKLGNLSIQRCKARESNNVKREGKGEEFTFM